MSSMDSDQELETIDEHAEDKLIISNDGFVESQSFIPPRLHMVFPARMYPMSTYAQRMRSLIKRSIKLSSSVIGFCLLVNRSIDGATPQQRFSNMLASTQPTQVPLYIFNGRSSNLHYNRLHIENIRKKMKYFDVFHTLIWKNDEDHNLMRNRRTFITIVVRLLFAKVQSPPNISHLKFCFINAVTPLCFWRRYAESVCKDEISEEAIKIHETGRYIICPHVECEDGNCAALLHFKDFDYFPVSRMSTRRVEHFDETLTGDKLLASTKLKVYYNYTFGLDSVFVKYPADRSMASFVDAISSLKADISAYQRLSMCGFNYIIAAARVPAGTIVPEKLSLDLFNENFELYLWVGHHHQAGLRNHLSRCTTSLSKTIISKKLNAFWLIRNDAYVSSFESEKHEAIMQLMIRRVILDQPSKFIFGCNTTQEVVVLDFCSDSELNEIATILDNENLPFLCDSVDILPSYRKEDYGLFGGPLELSKAEIYYMQ